MKKRVFWSVSKFAWCGLRLVVHTGTGVDLEYIYVATRVVVAYAFVFTNLDLLSYCLVKSKITCFPPNP